MGFKDMFNKGLDAIKNGANAAKEAAKEKKESMQEFDLLKTKSEHIGPMQVYVKNNEDPQIGKETLILNMCANVNVEQAKMINQIIPVDETILNVKAARESKTEKEYIFVITNKKMWVLNQNEYITYDFPSIKNFEIVNKGIMSQSIKFNDNAWVVSGNEDEIKTLGDILLREDARSITTEAKCKYLCGVTPIKQVLNSDMKGVSIGNNKQIVLHNNPDNKLISLNDIAYVQLLMNDSVVLVKGKPGVDQGSMVSTPLEARKMSVKVILGMGEYTIETMKPGTFNKSYKREDSTYIENYEFAKKVVDTLVELVEENRKGNASFVAPSANSNTQSMSQPEQAVSQNSVSTPSQTANQASMNITPGTLNQNGSVNSSTQVPSSGTNTTLKNTSIPDMASVFGGTSTNINEQNKTSSNVNYPAASSGA